MEQALVAKKPSDESILGDLMLLPRKKLGKSRREATVGGRVDAFPVQGMQNSECSAAQLQSLVEHGIEHRREVAGRGIDHLQHLGGGGLSLQRFVALGAAFVELPLEFRVGPLKIGCRVVDRRGHALIPSGRGSGTTGR